VPDQPGAPSERLPRPDLAGPTHGFTVVHQMRASAAGVYRAWTAAFDSWFAKSGVIRMRPVVDEPFFFETEHQGSLHPHHGRFLTLEPDHLVELTWMTGRDGTGGAETVVRVELLPTGYGTLVRVTHSGFYDEAAAAQHAAAWPMLLAHLDERLAETSGSAGKDASPQG